MPTAPNETEHARPHTTKRTQTIIAYSLVSTLLAALLVSQLVAYTTQSIADRNAAFAADVTIIVLDNLGWDGDTDTLASVTTAVTDSQNMTATAEHLPIENRVEVTYTTPDTFLTVDIDAARCFAFPTDGGGPVPCLTPQERDAAVAATNILDSDVTTPLELPATPEQDHTDQVEAAAR